MKTSVTPASDHLFKTSWDSIVLEDPHENVYHVFVPKSLFATNIAITDIHTAVKFIIMQVRAQNEEECKKLVFMIRNLRGIPEIPLNINADRTNTAK